MLVVAPSAIAGGAERAVANLMQRLPALGWTPHVAIRAGDPLPVGLDPRSHVEVVPFGRLRNPLDVVRSVATLRAMARRVGAQAILSNMSPAHIYGGLTAMSLRLPAVWWQQTIPLPHRGWPVMNQPFLERVAARVPADLVVASSDAAVASQHALTPRRNVLKVHLGIDIDATRSTTRHGTAVRSRLGWETSPVVGIAGWLHPWKGQDVFLRAVDRVRRRFPDARFALVGGTGNAAFDRQLRELVGELGLQSHVHFAGHQRDIYDWYDAMDVVVHASWGEAFGLVVVEAMALGKPVVATSVGGPSEIVVNGESGILVQPGDDVAMASAIESILADRAAAARMGAGARVRAELFSADRMSSQFADALDMTLGRRRSGAEARGA